MTRITGWILLLLAALLTFAIVALPVWFIQPFKPQSGHDLSFSFALRRWSPWVTVIALIGALLVVAALWRGARRWWKKAALLLILLPVFASTWFARQNHFEWMFNPLPKGAYAKASDTSFVADTDMVLAVENNGEAVAYPVRLMAYHHLVQDVVGGLPIVATY